MFQTREENAADLADEETHPPIPTCFSHLYQITFSVESETADARDVGGTMLLEALSERLKCTGPDDIIEAATFCPHETEPVEFEPPIDG